MLLNYTELVFWDGQYDRKHTLHFKKPVEYNNNNNVYIGVTPSLPAEVLPGSLWLKKISIKINTIYNMKKMSHTLSWPIPSVIQG